MTFKTLFVGIDIGKLKHEFAIVNEQQQFICKPFVIKDDDDGYHHLIRKLDHQMQLFNTTKFYIGLESKGSYWKNIYYYLKKQPIPCSVTLINPIQTKVHGYSELKRAKTKPVNAKDIALFMAEKKPAASFDRDPIGDIIKDIAKQMYLLKKQRTMSLNRLHIELIRVAPEIEKKISNLQGKQILALLSQFPTAEMIAKSSVDELRHIHYGKKYLALSASFIEKVTSLSQNSIAYKTGIGSGSVVQSLVRCIWQFQQEIDGLKSELVELYHIVSDADSLLTTIPGISRETAIILEAYIGDVMRFRNVKKIVAYFGMNPPISMAGRLIRSSYLRKKGNPIVRQKLFMATIGMIGKKIAPIYTFYKRLIDAGKPKPVAIGAAMRKLLVIIYCMLKKNENFKFKGVG